MRPGPEINRNCSELPSNCSHASGANYPLMVIYREVTRGSTEIADRAVPGITTTFLGVVVEIDLPNV